MNKIQYRQISRKLVKCGVTSPPQYLTGPDLFNGHVPIPNALVYPGGLDPAQVEAALQKVLRKYPPVCGRMRKDGQGKQYIDSNDAGVIFRVCEVQGPMPKFGVSNPIGTQISSLTLPIYPWRVVDKDTPLFQANIYQFSCGGSLLCMNGVHSMWDGSGLWGFLMDWARAARGEEIAEPDLDRSALIEISKSHSYDPNNFRLVYEQSWSERLKVLPPLAYRSIFQIRKEVFHIPAQAINAWKAEAKAELPADAGVTAQELASAFCIQQLSRAMPSQAERCIGIVFDLRHKRRLRIARNYFGNALGYGEARYTAQELASSTLAPLARKCRPSTADGATETLFSHLALMEQFRQKDAVWRLFLKTARDTLDAGLILNNCSNFPMYEIDFGRGKPSWYEVTGVAFRMLMLVPAPEGDGSLDFHLSAPRKELAAFRVGFEAGIREACAQG